MRARGILLVGLLVIAAAVGGLWWWGKPRSNVAMPTAASSPEQVVRAYVRALDQRDFATSNALQPYGGSQHWWSMQVPTITDLKIERVVTMSAHDRATSAAADWKQGVEVWTTATFHHWSGIEDSPGMPWTYLLVRNSPTERWRILDWGQG